MGCFGAKIFTKLLDVPSSYVSQSLKLVRVNIAELALEFVALADLGIPTTDTIDNTKDVAIATVEVVNTVVETTLYTGAIGADVLKVGNVLKFHANGLITSDAPGDDITLKIYIGATEFLSFLANVGKITDKMWHLDGFLTVRSIGAAGDGAFHMHLNINGMETVLVDTDSIDTTIAEDFTLTAIWEAAKATNTITLLQGFTEWKNLS